MRRHRPPTLRELERQCDDWNEAVRIGDRVRYHAVIGQEAYEVFKTAGRAWILSGHTAVVNLAAKSGCVALEACELDQPEAGQ